MNIRECERFIKQFHKLGRKYTNINEDLNNTKEQLISLAFRECPPRNKSLTDISLKNSEKRVKVWLIRFLNRDTHRGANHGYRLFYCKKLKVALAQNNAPWWRRICSRFHARCPVGWQGPPPYCRFLRLFPWRSDKPRVRPR